jgi:hypothetical protein
MQGTGGLTGQRQQEIFNAKAKRHQELGNKKLCVFALNSMG